MRSDCDLDHWCEEDRKYGGPGDDALGGNLKSDQLFGGRGRDLLIDDKTTRTLPYGEK